MRTALALVCCITLLAGGCARPEEPAAPPPEDLTVLSAGAWPMGRAEVEGTSRTVVEGPLEPQVLWGTDEIRYGNAQSDQAPVLTSDGRVVIGTESGVLVFDDSGSELWHAEYGQEYVDLSSPAVHPSGLIVASFRGLVSDFPVNVDIPDRLRALTLNGGEAWLWEEDEPQSGPVIGADGLIYFLGGDELSGPRVLYAVNSDGVTERTVSLGPGGLLEWGFANVVLRETDNGVEAFTASTDTLFRVLPDDTVRSGSVPPTSRKTLGGYEGDLWGLALDEGRNMLYVSHSTGEIMAFDADTLAHKWTCTLPGLVGSIPAIGDDAIYIGQCDDSHYDPMTNRSRAVHHHGVCAIDHSGNLKWTTPMPGEIRASLAVDGRGDVYAAVREEPRADGLVYSIKPDGSVRWRIALPHHEWAISAPAVGHDNRVYVFNESLWAIGEAGGSSGGTRDDTSNDGSADDPRGGDGDGAGGRAADW